MFFADQNDHTLVNQARAICLGWEDGVECPVLQLCRDHGLRYEEYGIFGGLTDVERRHLRRGTTLAQIRKQQMPFVGALQARRKKGSENAKSIPSPSIGKQSSGTHVDRRSKSYRQAASKKDKGGGAKSA